MDVLLFGIRKFRNIDQNTGEAVVGLSLQYGIQEEGCFGFRGRQKAVYSTDALYASVLEIAKNNDQWPCLADFSFGPWNSILDVKVK